MSAPRHIFVVLQSKARVGTQLQSHMIFDPFDVRDVSLRINGHQEPSENIVISFEENKVARAYYCLTTFMGRDQNNDTGLQISQLDFTTLYPIDYFSLKHMDLTKQSVVDIHFKATVVAIPPAGPPAVYRFIAVILADKAMLIEGVVGRMRVIDARVGNM